MLGFFKDELFFAAASRERPGVAALAVAGAALTFAYLARFWLGISPGAPVAPGQLPLLLVAPVVILAAYLAGWPDLRRPSSGLAERAAAVTQALPG